jgi:tellurite resistance protein TerC
MVRSYAGVAGDLNLKSCVFVGVSQVCFRFSLDLSSLPLFRSPTAFMTANELYQGLIVIASLVLIEGLLSVDNVLGIAALAKQLPEDQQKKAIRLGMIGAYLFRVVALILASVLISQTWVRWLGALYLIYLMSSHLTAHANKDADENHDGVPDSKQVPFSSVLTQIALMDLSLSIDNVIAAVGLAPKVDGHPVMWPIYVGVMIAILALQAIAPHAVTLLKRFPIMEPVAFILIGFVGCILAFEEAWHVIYHQHVHVDSLQKFAGIVTIVLIALAYNSSSVVQALFRPLFAVATPLMRVFSWIVEKVFWPAGFLLKAIIGAFSKKEA